MLYSNVWFLFPEYNNYIIESLQQCNRQSLFVHGDEHVLLKVVCNDVVMRPETVGDCDDGSAGLGSKQRHGEEWCQLCGPIERNLILNVIIRILVNILRDLYFLYLATYNGHCLDYRYI